MDRIRTLMILALALPLIGAIAVGCNTGTEEPAVPDSESAANAGTGTDGADEVDVAVVEIDPARFPELSGEVQALVPDNYPKDIPIYPGAVPAQGRGISHEGSEMSAMQLLTNDSPEQTLEFYAQELETKGWTIEQVEDTPERSSISVIKDGCKANFLFAPSPTGTGTDIYTISTCEGS